MGFDKKKDGLFRREERGSEDGRGNSDITSRLSPELAEEMFIWRPLLRGLATYSEITSTMTLIDLIKLNALLDMQDYISEQENKRYDKIK